jgi:chromosome segregation ATPase
LADSEKYRYLCEKRIKQLYPLHKFPVTQEDLKDGGVSELITIEKYDALHKQYLGILAEYNELKVKHSQSSLKNAKATFDFPDANNLTPNKLKEFYNKLLSLYSQELSQKDELLKAMRRETLVTEEQRNKIEILTGIIENNIPGITDYLTYDNLINFDKFNSEIEFYKQELFKAQKFMEDLKREVCQLRNCNEEVHDKKTKLKNTLESGFRELNETREQMYNLEVANNQMEIEITKLRGNNKNLNDELDDIRKGQRFKGLSDAKENSYEKINENLLRRINEYEINFKELNQEFEKIIKEKVNLGIENENLKNDLKTLFDSSEMLKLIYEKDREEWKIEFEKTKHIRNLFEELNQENQEFKKIIRHKTFRNNKLIQENKTIKSNLEKLNQENSFLKEEIFKQDSENTQIFKEYEEDAKEIKEKQNILDLNNEQLKTALEKLEKFNFEKESELMILCAEINRLKKLFRITNNDKINLAEEFDELNNSYINLNSNFKSISTELQSEKLKSQTLSKNLELVKQELNDKEERIKAYINKLKQNDEYFDKNRDESLNKFKEINTAYNSLKNSTDSIFNQICLNVIKFNNNIGDTNGYHTEGFKISINKLKAIIDAFNDKLLNSTNSSKLFSDDETIVNIIEEYVKAVTIELDVDSSKIQEDQNYMKELNNKLLNLDKLNKEAVLQNSENEKLANQKIKCLTEELEKVTFELRNTNNCLEEIKNELNIVTNERDETIKESKEMRNELFSKNSRYHKMERKCLDLKNETVRLNDTISKNESEYKYIMTELNNIEKLFLR